MPAKLGSLPNECLLAARAGAGKGGTHFMLGRSRMTIDRPLTPTMSGQSTPGLHRPGRHSLGQARDGLRVDKIFELIDLLFFCVTTFKHSN